MSAQKPTVVHLLRSTTISGAERVALQIMGLTAESYDTVYVSPKGDIEHYVTEAGMRYYGLEKANVGCVRRAIKDIRPDIIHAHDFMMSALAVLAHTGVPVVSHLHNNPPWLKNPLFPGSLAFAMVAPWLKAIITVSSSVENEYVYRRVLGNRVRVLPNVVDGERVRRMAKEDTRFDVPEKPFLMFLGRLAEPKNPLAFVRIMGSLRDAGVDVRGVMAGDGEMRDEVRGLVQELGLEDRVDMLGFVENPYPLLVQASALVMPSTFEGFGLAAVEAMCLGIPVFASPVGGLVDVVDAASGRLCSDEAEFAKELAALLSGGSEATFPPDAVQRSSERFCDLEDYREGIEAVYRALDTSRRPTT